MENKKIEKPKYEKPVAVDLKTAIAEGAVIQGLCGDVGGVNVGVCSWGWQNTST